MKQAIQMFLILTLAVFVGSTFFTLLFRYMDWLDKVLK